jgi:hypothetical protein
VDASVHAGGDDRAEVLVLDGSFVLVVSALAVAVHLRDVLQITFATLVADGAI